jgi:hypothetical protein
MYTVCLTCEIYNISFMNVKFHNNNNNNNDTTTTTTTTNNNNNIYFFARMNVLLALYSLSMLNLSDITSRIDKVATLLIFM